MKARSLFPLSNIILTDTPSIDYDDVLQRIVGIYNSCNETERILFKSILEEMQDKGYSQTLEQIWLKDFVEVPVSIDQFISDDKYLGGTNNNGQMIYPFWRKTLNDIFTEDKNYYEILFSGATRIGKTSTAITGIAYMLYRLMIYRDPHSYFRKKSVSKFTLAFANLTKSLAAGVGYREFNDTLKQVPWFVEHGRFSRSEQNYFYMPEGDRIEIIAVSDAAHLLGKQLWCALMDEVNFSQAGVKDINKAKVGMKKLYDTANARITGTFKIRGQVYGKLFTCSSKNSDSDYLSDHIETQLNAGNTSMYLVDEPQWKVLPPEMFSTDTFYITVGDRYKRGFVVSDDNSDSKHLQAYRDEGYDLLEVPRDFISNFKSDYDIALRDIAGISVVGSMGFITQDSVTVNVSEERKNPFYFDILVCGVSDTETIERNFHIEEVPTNLRKLPMYIHIDFAEVSDHIGICGCVQDGTKVVTDIDNDRKIVRPFYRQIFQVAIEAPRGDRMSYRKVMNFVTWLRRNGFNVHKITTDQFQSSYVREELSHQGFEVEKVSVDTSEDPYIGLRNVLSEQRIELIKHELQEDELVNLQRVNGRIDHPPQSSDSSGRGDSYSRSGPPGNGYGKGIGKDCADALCGSIWSLIQEDKLPQPSGPSMARMINQLNGGLYSTSRPSVMTNSYTRIPNNKRKR